MADASIKNIPSGLKKEFKILCEQNDTSMNHVLINCMAEYVKKHKTPHVP